MKRSEGRFLTTHTGSLPRPADLIRMMFAKEEGVPVDQAALSARIRSAVAEVVRQQVEAGLDVVNDGEVSKPSYATYIKDRLHGFGGTSQPLQYQDLVDFPELARRVFSDPGRSRRRTPACNGPISVPDVRAVHTDVESLFDHVKLPPEKVLIPGVIESKTNYVEHPEVVAQRISRYARLVGRERVIAGTDCGFGTWVGQAAVDPGVVWVKMASLVEGARVASRAFW
jgi:methionine synthase II (cobalamin-independent)